MKRMILNILLSSVVLVSLSGAALAAGEISLEEMFQEQYGSSTEPVFANVFVNAGGSPHFLTDEEEAHCYYEIAPSKILMYKEDTVIKRMVQEGFFDSVEEFEGENGLLDFTSEEKYVFAYFDDESIAENQFRNSAGRIKMNWLVYEIAKQNGVELPAPDASKEEIKGTSMETIKKMTKDCYDYDFLHGEEGPLFIVYDLGPQK